MDKAIAMLLNLNRNGWVISVHDEDEGRLYVTAWDEYGDKWDAAIWRTTGNLQADLAEV
jgi:hypothetical protein